jgi:ribonucleoside-diphosphate reductase subunit M2
LHLPLLKAFSSLDPSVPYSGSKMGGLMPGLYFSNKLISRDDGLHCDFACLIYTKPINRLPAHRIPKIISSAVNIKLELVANALPVELIGMNLTMMCNYNKFCADRLLLDLGCSKHYNTRNLFEWMEKISIQDKTNFFEK